MKKKFFIFLGVLWAVYVGVATFFLNKPYLANEINTWEDGEIHYGYSISLFPAFVTLFDFEIRHQDRNVQWTAHIDRVSTFVNPFALLRQEFHVFFVKGKGIKYRFRMRQRKVQGEQETHRAPFPGLSPKPQRNPQSDGKPWKVTIGGVQLTSLNDIWFEEYRFNGHAHVSGKFHIRPHEEVSVGPAYLDIESGSISLGERAVAKMEESRFRVELTPFHPDQVDNSKLTFVNIDGNIDLEKIHFDALNLYLIHSPWIHILKGTGSAKCEFELKEGAFKEKTKLSAEAEETEVKIFDQILKGKTLIDWKVGPFGQNASLASRFGIGLKNFNLRGEKGKDYANGDAVKATLQSPDLDLNRFLNLVAGRLEVSALRVVDLSFISEYFPPFSDVKVTKGKAQVDGFLNFGPKGSDDSGNLQINLKDGGLLYKDLLFNVQVAAQVRLPKGHVQKRQFETKGTLVTVSTQFKDKSWSGNVKIERGEMTFAKPFRFSGRVKTQMTDLSPFMAIYAEGKPLPGVLEALLQVNDVEVSSDIQTNHVETRFDGLELTSDKLKLSARLKYSKDDSQTLALAQFGPFAVGIEKTPHSNRVILNDALKWFQQKNMP